MNKDKLLSEIKSRMELIEESNGKGYMYLPEETKQFYEYLDDLVGWIEDGVFDGEERVILKW